MNSSRHAPGPWTFQPESPDYYAAVTVDCEGAEVSICEFPEGEDCAANGRLISAAPELLAALQAALCLYDQGQMKLDGDSGSDPLIESARAAIAKATATHAA